MPDDDNDGPWVTDWDEIDGVDDDELFEDEYIDEPEVRPTRAVPLAADRYDAGDGGYGDGGYDDGGYDDGGYDDDGEGRRRRALLVVAAALAFVLVGVAVAAALVGRGDDDVETNAASSSSSSTTRATPPSLGALPGQQPAPGASSTVPSGSSSTSTSQATTSTTKATTTTSEPADGPACSPTATSPSAPGNLPMKVAFCVDDPTPKVGQVVTLSGTAEDLDGGVTLDCVKVSWEGEEFGECFPPQADPAMSYNESYTFKHAFANPGTYTIHVGAQSGKPNGSFAEAKLKITVHA